MESLSIYLPYRSWLVRCCSEPPLGEGCHQTGRFLSRHWPTPPPIGRPRDRKPLVSATRSRGSERNCCTGGFVWHRGEEPKPTPRYPRPPFSGSRARWLEKDPARARDYSKCLHFYDLQRSQLKYALKGSRPCVYVSHTLSPLPHTSVEGESGKRSTKPCGFWLYSEGCGSFLTVHRGDHDHLRLEPKGQSKCN